MLRPQPPSRPRFGRVRSSGFRPPNAIIYFPPKTAYCHADSIAVSSFLELKNENAYQQRIQRATVPYQCTGIIGRLGLTAHTRVCRARRLTLRWLRLGDRKACPRCATVREPHTDDLDGREPVDDLSKSWAMEALKGGRSIFRVVILRSTCEKRDCSEDTTPLAVSLEDTDVRMM